MILNFLLLLALASAAALAALGDRPWAGWLAAGLYTVLLAVLAIVPVGTVSAFQPEVLGHTLIWRMTGLGRFFAVIAVGAALLAALFGAGEWRRHQPGLRLLHGSMALNVAAMLLLFTSGDLLTLFIGWELVTWTGYLVLTQRGGPAVGTSFRYLIYALGGGMAVLAGLVMVHAAVGALAFDAVRAAVPTMAPATLGLLAALFGAGFGVKMGLMPFHLWQAGAYAETPGPITAFVSAIAARTGLFAMAVVLIRVLGPETLGGLGIPYTFLDGQLLLAWIAAITAVVPTFIALTQRDARYLLAWHGIGQGGYMILGLMAGPALGAAGGLLHVLNHATYQAGLFLAVAAVAHRTGTTDLDRLGGLINRMPWSYVTMLIGIIGLAGLPPTNGFVSKWLIYKALLEAGSPLLFLAAVIATLGTILSVYKLLHNTFLGQLRVEHYAVREVPWSMRVPMLITVGLVLVTGTAPGLALDLVAPGLATLDLAVPAYHLGGVATTTGSLNMMWVGSALTFGFVVGMAVFFTGNPSRQTHQWDNYAGGHFLSADIRYHYSHDFYPGLMRALAPVYRGSFRWAESALIAAASVGAVTVARLYRAAPVPAYLILGVVVAAWWGWTR